MRILIATSGRQSAEPAIEQGAYVAKRLKVRPTLLLVGERGHIEGAAALEAAADRLRQLGVEAETRLRQGRPADEIIAEVKEGAFDLLVIGEGRHLSLIERVFGHTTQKVLAQIPCAVLMANAVRESFGHILVCDSLASEGGLVKAFLTKFLGLLADEREVTILHVMSQMGAGPSVEGWELRANADELIERKAIEGELITEDLERAEQSGKLKPVAKVRHGLVVDEIVDEMSEGAYDLLVLGAHRGEGWERFLLEDLAGEIVKHSKVPVLVLPRKLAEQDD
jgi:nucleotide-binding universal stress UspA family protein